MQQNPQSSKGTLQFPEEYAQEGRQFCAISTSNQSSQLHSLNSPDINQLYGALKGCYSSNSNNQLSSSQKKNYTGQILPTQLSSIPTHHNFSKDSQESSLQHLKSQVTDQNSLTYSMTLNSEIAQTATRTGFGNNGYRLSAGSTLSQIGAASKQRQSDIGPHLQEAPEFETQDKRLSMPEANMAEDEASLILKYLDQSSHVLGLTNDEQNQRLSAIIHMLRRESMTMTQTDQRAISPSSSPQMDFYPLAQGGSNNYQTNLDGNVQAQYMKDTQKLQNVMAANFIQKKQELLTQLSQVNESSAAIIESPMVHLPRENYAREIEEIEGVVSPETSYDTLANEDIEEYRAQDSSDIQVCQLQTISDYNDEIHQKKFKGSFNENSQGNQSLQQHPKLHQILDFENRRISMGQEEEDSRMTIADEALPSKDVHIDHKDVQKATENISAGEASIPEESIEENDLELGEGDETESDMIETEIKELKKKLSFNSEYADQVVMRGLKQQVAKSRGNYATHRRNTSSTSGVQYLSPLDYSVETGAKLQQIANLLLGSTPCHANQYKNTSPTPVSEPEFVQDENRRDLANLTLSKEPSFTKLKKKKGLGGMGSTQTRKSHQAPIKGLDLSQIHKRRATGMFQTGSSSNNPSTGTTNSVNQQSRKMSQEEVIKRQIVMGGAINGGNIGNKRKTFEPKVDKQSFGGDMRASGPSSIQQMKKEIAQTYLVGQQHQQQHVGSTQSTQRNTTSRQDKSKERRQTIANHYNQFKKSSCGGPKTNQSVLFPQSDGASNLSESMPLNNKSGGRKPHNAPIASQQYSKNVKLSKKKKTSLVSSQIEIGVMKEAQGSNIYTNALHVCPNGQIRSNGVNQSIANALIGQRKDERQQQRKKSEAKKPSKQKEKANKTCNHSISPRNALVSPNLLSQRTNQVNSQKALKPLQTNFEVGIKKSLNFDPQSSQFLETQPAAPPSYRQTSSMDRNRIEAFLNSDLYHPTAPHSVNGAGLMSFGELFNGAASVGLSQSNSAMQSALGSGGKKKKELIQTNLTGQSGVNFDIKKRSAAKKVNKSGSYTGRGSINTSQTAHLANGGVGTLLGSNGQKLKRKTKKSVAKSTNNGPKRLGNIGTQIHSSSERELSIGKKMYLSRDYQSDDAKEGMNKSCSISLLQNKKSSAPISKICLDTSQTSCNNSNLMFSTLNNLTAAMNSPQNTYDIGVSTRRPKTALGSGKAIFGKKSSNLPAQSSVGRRKDKQANSDNNQSAKNRESLIARLKHCINNLDEQNSSCLSSKSNVAVGQSKPKKKSGRVTSNPRKETKRTVFGSIGCVGISKSPNQSSHRPTNSGGRLQSKHVIRSPQNYLQGISTNTPIQSSLNGLAAKLSHESIIGSSRDQKSKRIDAANSGSVGGRVYQRGVFSIGAWGHKNQ